MRKRDIDSNQSLSPGAVMAARNLAIRRQLLTLSVAAIISGCSKPPAAPPAASTAPTRSNTVHVMDEVRFEVPSNWTIEEVQEGVLLLAPIVEADWQANIFLQFRRDPEHRSLQDALDDVVVGLGQQKSAFRETRRVHAASPQGLKYGMVEYECLEPAHGVPLSEYEIVLYVSEEKVLFILASSTSSLWVKYRPIFDAFMSSVTLGV